MLANWLSIWLLVHRKANQWRGKEGGWGSGRLHWNDMSQSAAVFNLLEVEIMTLVQYQFYSIPTDLLQLWMPFAMKPAGNAILELEKAISLQNSAILCLLARREAEAGKKLCLPGSGGRDFELLLLPPLNNNVYLSTVNHLNFVILTYVEHLKDLNIWKIVCFWLFLSHVEYSMMFVKDVHIS